MNLITRGDRGRERGALTMIAPEKLAAMAADCGHSRVTPTLPGPANGVHVAQCDHPDCNGTDEQ